MKLSDTNELLSHHTYLLTGSDSAHSTLISLLEKNNLVTNTNPDFFDRPYETFTIDNARELKLFHNTRPVTPDGKKIFVLRMNGITVEAQNALLKLFEEPADYAHFFIIISSAHLLLPTVKSRMRSLELGKDLRSAILPDEKNQKEKNRPISKTDQIDPELLKNAQKFITLSKAKKLEEVKKLVDDISKERKTKQYAVDFLNSIEALIYEEKDIKEGRSALEAIDMAKTYIHDRAPSVKMLLEYVTLNI